MRPDLVWRVAWRDLLSTLRDQRTLRATILMPLLLIPLMTLGLPLLMGNLIGGQANTKQKVGVIGTLPPELRQLLTDSAPRRTGLPSSTGRLRPEETTSDEAGSKSEGVELIPVKDALSAVQSGEVEAVIVVKKALPQRATADAVPLELYAKLGNLRTQAGAYSKVQDAVDRYNQALATQRLGELGLSPAVLEPVKLQAVDASLPQERASGQLAFLVPMLMINFILAGAMATALDSTAGEKERGTLESLLVSPVRRSEVVAGKLLATTLVALASSLCSLAGFLLSGVAAQFLVNDQNRVMVEQLGGKFSLSGDALSAMLFVVLSTALLLSGLLIAISIFARSYKEAQTYVSPISIFIIFPALALQFSDFWKAGAALYFVPLLGGMVALLDIVKGNMEWSHVLPALLGNLLATLLLCFFAWRSFHREEVIFRN